ncbi:hypothetical protein MMPV_002135 [Pyropia vietnamensis]
MRTGLLLRAKWTEGDSLLDYEFALLKERDIVLELINTEVGPAGVEGDEPGLLTASVPTSRGKRKRRMHPDFQALVESSASIAASAAKHARLAELVALSTTLKNAREAGLSLEIVTAIRTQFEAALRSSVGSQPDEARQEHGAAADAGHQADALGTGQRGRTVNGGGSHSSVGHETTLNLEAAGRDGLDDEEESY